MNKLLLLLCVLALLTPAPANADEPKVLRGHREMIRSVAFFKDGRYLLSRGLTTALWDVLSAAICLNRCSTTCSLMRDWSPER